MTLWSSFFLIFRPGRESDSDAEDLEHAEKLRQVKAVLEEVCLDTYIRSNLLSSLFETYSFVWWRIVLGNNYIVSVRGLNSRPDNSYYHMFVVDFSSMSSLSY